MKTFISTKITSIFGKKTLIYLIPVLAIAFIAGGCNQKTENGKDSNALPSVEEQDKKQTQKPEELNVNIVHGAKLAGTRVELDNLQNLKPGENILAFKLFGLDAHEFGPNDLKISHEKYIHLMLVRDDMQYYQHLHPEFLQGKWTIKTNIPKQGNYEMYVDFDAKEEKPTVLRMPLKVGGETQDKMFPKVSENLSVKVDGITASLDRLEIQKPSGKIKLKYLLSQNGKPVSQVEKYLGAFGHTVALRHGEPDHFVHAHPLNETIPTNGVLEFEIDLDEAGMYTVFAQFNINGEVKTFPITIEAEGQSAVETKIENKHME